ncbi:MAG: GntR family transcriptional regulator [Polaromonas sp.]|nr:GntR family transcriptional regulator [Polaromonas sp.]
MSTLKSTSDYMLLAQTLESNISSGRAAVGSLLPTETQLCEQYGMSRITVRAALRQLQDKGLVTRRAGVGTRVQAASIASQYVQAGDSIDAVLQFTQGLSFELLSIHEVSADAELVSIFDVPVGQLFVCATGVRRSPKQSPTVLSRHFIPAIYASVQGMLDGHKGSIAQLIAEQANLDITTISQSIDTCRLSAPDSRTLETSRNTPALRTRRNYYGPGNALMLSTESLFPEGRYRFTSVLRRERVAH